MLAAAGIGIGVWLHNGTRTLTVLRPKGLHASKRTFSSVSLAWSKATGGARPTKYEVFEDGGLVASVPGTATSYRVGGLAPNEAISFRLMAIHGQEHSPDSTPLSVATPPVPPISSAELTGKYHITYSQISTTGLQNPPQSYNSDNWAAALRCASGPCSVLLSGQFQGSDFADTVLHRNGAFYTGRTTLTNYFTCSNKPRLTYLTIRLKVTAADVFGSQWRATSWSGTFTATAPTATCTALTVTTHIAGS